jgi:hypothetical protein
MAFGRQNTMRINHNNYLKNLGTTEAEMQAALKAEQKRKDIQVESEAAEKIRKFQDQVAGAADKQQKESGWAGPEKKPLQTTKDPKAEDPGSDDPPPARSGHIDIKV